MIATGTTNLMQRVSGAIRAEARKAAILGVAVLVLAGMWWRAAGELGPQTSQAFIAPPAQISPATLAPRVLPALPSPAFAEWSRAPLAPLGRNVFAVKLDYYRQDTAAAVPALRAPTGDGFWDLLAKSLTARADQRKERRILLENLQLQAAQIRLQSTLMGSRPQAMINGALVAEGDVVAGFRVLKIEPRRLIVEREGVKLEVAMK